MISAYVYQQDSNKEKSMSSPDYGLGQLNMSRLKFPTTTKNEDITFCVWGGRFRINVTKTGELRPICEFVCTGEKGFIIRKTIERVIKSSPGTRYPIIFSQWDQNERKFKPSHAITFIKDDKNVYRVEIKYKGITYESIIRGPSGIAFGSDVMSDAEKSGYGIEYLLDYVSNTVRIQELLTNKKMERTPNAARNVNNGSTMPTADEDFF